MTSPLALPVLETDRLTIRPFTTGDLAAIHQVLCQAWDVPPGQAEAQLAERERWLRWTIDCYEELDRLVQPPYGDRAIVRRQDGLLIGSVGFVPSLGPFGQLPGFAAHPGSRRFYSEVGLFWAVDPSHQGHGYAAEAAHALITFAFEQLNLGRIIATTERTNERSMAVMKKLGMRLLENPEAEPDWFQVVGVRERT